MGAIKSFVGYLEGTQKSAHTIKNYRLDLQNFQDYLNKQTAAPVQALDRITEKHLESFHDFLKVEGQKTNTRRRKLLTVRRFLEYLAKRKKVSIDVSRKLAAPHKVERVPFTVSAKDLIAEIKKLPTDSVLSARNRVLLWTLAETGCLVSEISQIRYENWSIAHAGDSEPQAVLELMGKSPRTLTVSPELYLAVQDLKQKAGNVDQAPWVFYGFNKFGSLGAPITSRGVELLVKHYAVKLNIPKLTPRTFRQSIVIHWFKQGVPQAEIQKRLGLKSDYAFRVFEPILSKSRSNSTSGSKTISSGETSQ